MSIANQVAIYQTVKQNQKLVMNAALKQALLILELPYLDLCDWLENTIEQNPILQLRMPYKQDFSIQQIASIKQPKESLYHYLCNAIRLYFKTDEEMKLAYFIAGSLNKNGFLTTSEEEICLHVNAPRSLFKQVIKQLHRIEPIGLGAKNTQECLLLQIEAQSKTNTLIYLVVKKYYSELIHNRLNYIALRLGHTPQKIKEVIQRELRYLNPFPGKQFEQDHNYSIIPDIHLDKRNDRWSIEVEGKTLPHFQIDPFYLQALQQHTLAKEEKVFIRRHLAEGKWLKHALAKRQKTLFDIATYIVSKQKRFLEGSSRAPIPLTKKDIAKQLQLSESTITRALLNKHIACPIGIIASNDLFSFAIQTNQGMISNRKVKDLLLQLIHQEDKTNPLSDRSLCEALHKQGIKCARRTVTKYRCAIKIQARLKRKEWH